MGCWCTRFCMRSNRVKDNLQKHRFQGWWRTFKFILCLPHWNAKDSDGNSLLAWIVSATFYSFPDISDLPCLERDVTQKEVQEGNSGADIVECLQNLFSEHCFDLRWRDAMIASTLRNKKRTEARFDFSLYSYTWHRPVGANSLSARPVTMNWTFLLGCIIIITSFYIIFSFKPILLHWGFLLFMKLYIVSWKPRVLNLFESFTSWRAAYAHLRLIYSAPTCPRSSLQRFWGHSNNLHNVYI